MTDREERRALRWLPAVVLAAVTATAAVVVAGIEPPPVRHATVTGPVSDTPVLSLRRNLEPLRVAASERRFHEGLDAFVATQPDDTCLEVEVGDLRYEHRVDDPQSPASVQKLLTAVAALRAIGPDETFATEVLATAPPVDGVVAGDLWLRGGGDPVLATQDYVGRHRPETQVFSDIGRLADAVVAAGVTTVAGAIVGDESRYDAVRYNPVWPPRFITQGQIGPLSALSVNDGFETPPPDGPFWLRPAAEPAAQAAGVLEAELRARGVTIGAPARAGTTPPEAASVVTHRSPPLRDIVAEMLRQSDNNTAELLLKELGWRREGEGSFPAGQAAVTAVLADAGLTTPATAVVDGSGLATEDTVTCASVVDLLGHGPTADLVREGLAVAGVSGTLARRWVGTELAGRVAAKTGTLNQVTALAGFAETEGGADARFSLLVNVAEPARIGPEVVAAQQQLAEVLVAHPQLPEVEALRPRPPGPR